MKKITKPSSLAQENGVETAVVLKTIKRIAKQELGITTLDARLSDELDFHNLAVWQIQKALVMAYIAGRDRC